MRETLSSIAIIEEENAEISSGRMQSRRGTNTHQMTLLVENHEQVQRILKRLNAVEGMKARRILETS